LISNISAAAAAAAGSAGTGTGGLASSQKLGGLKNSVVNVNLNVLKDVNIDEMIDDDDDEERKFLIKELEKKANNKQKTHQQINGSDQADSTFLSSTGSGGVKRSRSNSSTNNRSHLLSNLTSSPNNNQLVQNTGNNALSALNTSTNTTGVNQSILSQLNITLNCHYCWAQFQLNVSKNLKNSIQQKENGKYMQHLALHLNAPYKCNECSYPITDTKTFFKHKQFYKHDEKTCIMVDNDVNLPTNLTATQQQQALTLTRRKTLILTRLKQHQQQQLIQQQQQQQSSSSSIDFETNEIQFTNDRDTFKCSLCYSDTDQAPSTSVSSLNKTPTLSNLGASNFSFDKEQVLKHVLIVHLSFLAYKCDTCTQFYAFDEPQTKQHAGLVHQCGGTTTTAPNTENSTIATSSSPSSSSTTSSQCHFKLIKTEEEINLAINKAQQYITKIPAQTVVKSTHKSKNINQLVNVSTSSNVSIEAQPKYKCCRCSINAAAAATTVSTDGSNTTNATTGTTTGPILLYTYQDALDHVMTAHIGNSSGLNKKDKKLNYELELFEQNLEDLIASETGQVTTVTANSSQNQIHNNNECTDEDDEDDDDDDENGDFIFDEYTPVNDLSEWNVIYNEYQTNLSSSSSQMLSNSSHLSPSNAGGNKRKRFKTNNNTSLSLDNNNELSMNQQQSIMNKKSKKFYFKPHLVYKCQLCFRKMSTFNFDHWLQHDAENHYKLYAHSKLNSTDSTTIAKQSINCFKCSTQETVKTFPNFTQFLTHYKMEHLNPTTTATTNSTTQSTDQETTTLSTTSNHQAINCLVCGTELKCTYVDMLKHFQSEHELNLFDLKLNQTDLELIHTLQSNQLVQMSESVRVKKRCFIKVPPALINPMVAQHQNQPVEPVTKIDLINKELNLLNEIHREQIIEKQIVSWLNSEQFLRRNFNYQSYQCIICNLTKNQILESHYLNKQVNTTSTTNSSTNTNESVISTLATNRIQFYSEEMKTVVLTNHVLSHFNEYCYRCMSCKISWPDRTQLLKHSQECPNSQVVRTKTKYKLKANCRLQLKFYLQTYLDYWQHEKMLETRSLSCIENKLNFN